LGHIRGEKAASGSEPSFPAACLNDDFAEKLPFATSNRMPSPPFIRLDGTAENDMGSLADEKHFEKGADWQPDT
jgi:hypothetical protein